jgi:hypothetical protein
MIDKMITKQQIEVALEELDTPMNVRVRGTSFDLRHPDNADFFKAVLTELSELRKLIANDEMEGGNDGYPSYCPRCGKEQWGAEHNNHEDNCPVMLYADYREVTE